MRAARLTRRGVLAAALAAGLGRRALLTCGQEAIDTSRREPTFTTLTTLPPFPTLPPDPESLSGAEREELLQAIVDHKLSTYPATSSVGRRTGLHRGGAFAAFEPRPDQVRRWAAHYDLFLQGGAKGHLRSLIRETNPGAPVLMYFDAGLSDGLTLGDAGNVDAEDVAWIVANHPEWLLRDAGGNLLRGGFEHPQYWPDPGNPDWQAFFAAKAAKAIEVSGGDWDGMTIDQFLGHATSHRDFANTALQTAYPDDAAWQEAQLRFLEAVTAAIPVPLYPNVEPTTIYPRPDFHRRAMAIAGGAEAEIFVFHAPRDDGFLDDTFLMGYLDLGRSVPPGKVLLLNAETAGIAGDVDRTLYSYFTYLLIAHPERRIYWRYKEATSSIPPYWYREFDLDLGAPLAELEVVDGLWTRRFARATVVVNPPQQPAGEFRFEESFVDVLGRPVTSPVTVLARSAMLLVSDPALLSSGQTVG